VISDECVHIMPDVSKSTDWQGLFLQMNRFASWVFPGDPQYYYQGLMRPYWTEFAA